MKLYDKIEINASPKTIWTVLTQNNYVRQYMFNCEIDSNWLEGEPLTYYILKENNKVDMVLGNIVKIEKPTLLHHTLYPANADYPNIPENHIYVIYSIEERPTASVLSVQQGGFETAAEGEKRFEDAKGGWSVVLPQIKNLAEEIENDRNN